MLCEGEEKPAGWIAVRFLATLSSPAPTSTQAAVIMAAAMGRADHRPAACIYEDAIEFEPYLFQDEHRRDDCSTR